MLKKKKIIGKQLSLIWNNEQISDESDRVGKKKKLGLLLLTLKCATSCNAAAAAGAAAAGGAGGAAGGGSGVAATDR